MSADKTEDAATPTAEESVAEAPHLSDRVEAEHMRASMSAIVTADTGELDATASVLGVASLEGNADIGTSVVGIVSAKGDTTIHQAVAGAVVGGESVSVHQGGSPILISRAISMNTAGAGAMVAGEAHVERGWIGVLLTPRASLSEDSRVLIGPAAALILSVAVLGGFGLAAYFAARGARRMLSWRPEFVNRLMDLESEALTRWQQRRG